MTGMNATRHTRAPVRAYGCPARPATKINPMTHDKNGGPATAVVVTVIIAATFVALGTVGGAVALSLAGKSGADIVGLVAPVAAAAVIMVGALGQLVSLSRRQDQQSEKLDQVAHQTNGGLKQAVEDSVRRALAEQLGDREGRL